MPKSKVAITKTKPETVLKDIECVMKDARFDEALPRDRVTILKDNISWHFPFLSANTTPWQLEGTILALKNSGYKNYFRVFPLSRLFWVARQRQENSAGESAPYKMGKII